MCSINKLSRYRISSILARYKLLGVAGFLYSRYLGHKVSNLRRIQQNEIKSEGRYAQVPLFNCRFILDRTEFHDFLMLKILESGDYYEPEVTTFIVNHLRIGDIFLDIGSNNGYYSIIASQLVGPDGKVISIEPNKSTYIRLMENIKVNGIKNVNSFNIALSDHDGRAKLFLNNDSENGLASLINDHEKEPIDEVPVNTFDGLFLNQSINLIKMDVEGSEINIIKGMGDYLKKYNSVKIIMEWNPDYMGKEDYHYLDTTFRISLLFYSAGKDNEIVVEKYEQLGHFFGNLLLESKM